MTIIRKTKTGDIENINPLLKVLEMAVLSSVYIGNYVYIFRTWCSFSPDKGLMYEIWNSKNCTWKLEKKL